MQQLGAHFTKVIKDTLVVNDGLSEDEQPLDTAGILKTDRELLTRSQMKASDNYHELEEVFNPELDESNNFVSRLVARVKLQLSRLNSSVYLH